MEGWVNAASTGHKPVPYLSRSQARKNAEGSIVQFSMHFEGFARLGSYVLCLFYVSYT